MIMASLEAGECCVMPAHTATVIGSIGSTPGPGHRLYAMVSVGGQAEKGRSGGGDGGKQGLQQGFP
jgi:hypothetical protein